MVGGVAADIADQHKRPTQAMRIVDTIRPHETRMRRETCIFSEKNEE